MGGWKLRVRTLFDWPSHSLTPSQFILSLPILCSFTPPEMALVDYAATNDRDDGGGGGDQVALAAEGGGEDNAGVAAAAARAGIYSRSIVLVSAAE